MTLLSYRRTLRRPDGSSMTVLQDMSNQDVVDMIASVRGQMEPEEFAQILKESNNNDEHLLISTPDTRRELERDQKRLSELEVIFGKMTSVINEIRDI